VSWVPSQEANPTKKTRSPTLVCIRPQGTNRGQGPLQGINLIGPIFFSVGPISFIFHIRVRRCYLYQRAKGLVLNWPS
jgi:hypothetical protein